MIIKMISRTCVYRFFDAEGRLLYIGMTSRAAGRWVEHSAEQWWWSEVAFIKVAHFPTRDDAALEEMRAIRDEHPKYNTVRYDGKPYNRSIYRAYRTGSVYQARRDGKFIAAIRWYGTRHASPGFKDRAGAEAWLRDFLAAQESA